MIVNTEGGSVLESRGGSILASAEDVVVNPATGPGRERPKEQDAALVAHPHIRGPSCLHTFPIRHRASFRSETLMFQG